MRTARLPTLRWVLVAAVAVLVSCGGGSSLTQESPIIDCEANSANVDIWTPDLWVVADYCYKVGDTGPGGGIIVYVDVAGFDNSSGDGTSIGAMCLTGTCHYLEVGSPALREDFSLEEAIIKAEAFSTSSANDWLLPSDGALDVIFDWAVSLDELCEANHWSSPPERCAMLRRNNVHDGDAPQFDGLEQAAYWTSGNIVYYGDAYSLGGYTCFALPVRAF